MPRDTVEIEVFAPLEIPAKLEPWQGILLRAADLIEQRGWTQGRAEDNEGRLCMLGAISVAASHTVFDAYKAGTTAAGALYHYLGGPIPAWNDNAHVTKADVLRALRAAARMEA